MGAAPVAKSVRAGFPGPDRPNSASDVDADRAPGAPNARSACGRAAHSQLAHAHLSPSGAPGDCGPHQKRKAPDDCDVEYDYGYDRESHICLSLVGGRDASLPVDLGESVGSD
jgi:hypothetical protein